MTQFTQLFILEFVVLSLGVVGGSLLMDQVGGMYTLPSTVSSGVMGESGWSTRGESGCDPLCRRDGSDSSEMLGGKGSDAGGGRWERSDDDIPGDSLSKDRGIISCIAEEPAPLEDFGFLRRNFETPFKDSTVLEAKLFCDPLRRGEDSDSPEMLGGKGSDPDRGKWEKVDEDITVDPLPEDGPLFSCIEDDPAPLADFCLFRNNLEISFKDSSIQLCNNGNICASIARSEPKNSFVVRVPSVINRLETAVS